MERHFPQGIIHTLGVESLAETIADVETAGGQIANGPNEIPGIGSHADCTDPDGNLFGVLQSEEKTS